MTIFDFNKTKKLDIASVSGTPTVARVVPIKITSGAESTTGTGAIVLDWTNIADKTDIGVYDELNNLVDYSFESFDATAETATIHVHHTWVRDGSTQLQVAYGNGPGDQSVAVETVFDKETDLKAGWILNEASGNALDVTSNNNDGTVFGTTREVDGQVGEAYDFDGVDDYIEVPDSASMRFNYSTDDVTVMFWAKVVNNQSSDSKLFEKKGDSDSSGYGNAIFTVDGNSNDSISLMVRDDSGGNLNEVVGTTQVFDTGNWHHITAILKNGDTIEIHIDDVLEDSDSTVTFDSKVSDVETYIGWSYNEGARLTEGQLDQLRFHIGLVSADDRTALYDATKSSPAFFSQQAAVAPDLLPDAGYWSATPTRPNAAVTDFSLLVNLANFPQAFWDDWDTTDPTKMRVGKGDGTELGFDPINVDSVAQTGWLRALWIGDIPTGSDITLRVYSAKASRTSYAATDMFGQYNAYNNDWGFYLANGAHIDRTGNESNGTLEDGLTAAGATGQVGDGTNYDGVDDSVNMGSILDLRSQDFTFMFWANADTWNTSDQNTVMGIYSSTTRQLRFEVDHAPQTTELINQLRLSLFESDSPDDTQIIGTTQLNTGQWYHIAGRMDWTALTGDVYVDGVNDTNDPYSYFNTHVAAAPLEDLMIGQRANDQVSDQNWDGVLDELIVMLVSQSEAWINYEYQQSHNNAAFWSAWTASGTLVSVSDTGQGADGLSNIAAALGITDTGQSLDAIANIAVALGVSDVGQGVDIPAGIQATCVVQEQGVGTSAIVVTESGDIITVQDTGLGSDTVSPNAAVLVQDIASGADTIILIGDILKTINDVATGTDSAGVTVQLQVADTALGSDIVKQITAQIVIQEIATAQDIAVVFDSNKQIWTMTVGFQQRTIHCGPVVQNHQMHTDVYAHHIHTNRIHEV